MRKFSSRSLYTRWLPHAAAIGLCSLLTACHSPFVEATIDNQGSQQLHVVEVDYPSAGFGKNLIEAHSQYHYRFKILGSGSVKISFTDYQGTEHTSSGPELDEGEEGTLTIAVDDAAHIRWSKELKTP